jgi:hypothetical protein
MKNKYLKRIKFTLCFYGWLLAFTNLAKAQENQTIQSTLTLVTTDIMNSNIDNNLNWKNITLKKLVNRNLYTYTKDGSNCTPTGNFVAVSSPEGVLMCPECKEGGWDCADVKVQSVKTFIEPPENPKSGSGLSFNNSSFIPWSAGLNSGLTLWGFVNNSPNDLAGGGSNNGDEQNTSPNDNPNKPQTGLEDDEKPLLLLVTPKLKKPVEVICNDTFAAKSSKYLTALMESANKLENMKNLRDSLSVRKFEVGMALNKYGSNDSLYSYKYDTTGTSNMVTIQLNVGSIATIHTHPIEFSDDEKNVPSHSAGDIVETIENLKISPKALTSFVIAQGDTSSQDYALHIEDTALANKFLKDTLNTTEKLVNLNNSKRSWKGKDDNAKSNRGKFIVYKQQFEDDEYSANDAELFAQAVMIKKLNMGASFYKKVDGVFKKIKVEYDTTNEKYIIKICTD